MGEHPEVTARKHRRNAARKRWRAHLRGKKLRGEKLDPRKPMVTPDD